MTKTPTLEDVARKAGVSSMTVSNVLTGRRHVRPATRERVEAAIAETGYRANVMARALAGGRNRIISVFTPQLNRPYAAEVVQGAAEAAARLAYDLVVMMQAPQSHADFSTLTRLSVGALLIQPPDATDWTAGNLPEFVVSVDGPSAWPLRVDNYSGACQAVAHLLELGHTRIGLITGLEAEPDPGAGAPAAQDAYRRDDAHERLRGSLDTLHRAGRAVAPEHLWHGDFTLHSGMQGAQALLTTAEPPTALFVAGDAMAVGAMHAAQNLGYRIPEDLSVVGFDDLPLASTSRPALTTVQQPLQRLGEVAIELLVALDQGQAFPMPAPFATTLIVRGSTARPRHGDPPSGKGHLVDQTP